MFYNQAVLKYYSRLQLLLNTNLTHATSDPKLLCNWINQHKEVLPKLDDDSVNEGVCRVFIRCFEAM